MILGRRYAPAPARPALWAGLRGSLHRTCRHSAVARLAPILGGLMEPPSITIQGISHKDQFSQSGLDADRCSGYTHEQYRTSVARVATTLSPTSTVHLSERSRRPVRRAAGNERWYDHPHTLCEQTSAAECRKHVPHGTLPLGCFVTMRGEGSTKTLSTHHNG